MRIHLLVKEEFREIFQKHIKTKLHEWKTTLPDNKPGLCAVSEQENTMIFLVSEDIRNFYIVIYHHIPISADDYFHFYYSNDSMEDIIKSSQRMRSYFKRIVDSLSENFTHQEARNQLSSSKIKM